MGDIDERKVIILFLMIIVFICGATVGFYANRHSLCKEAYTAKVDQQLEACLAWKAGIDAETRDKLGVK